MVISVVDILIVITLIFKLLYSWLLIDPSEYHYKTQASKFNFLNRASTTLMSLMHDEQNNTHSVVKLSLHVLTMYFTISEL